MSLRPRWNSNESSSPSLSWMSAKKSPSRARRKLNVGRIDAAI